MTSNGEAVVSEIVIDEAYAAGLRGLDQFSHILVIFWMHQASFDPSRDLLRRPRGRDDMPELGLFAQRARHRPNPIGITAVELLEVSEPILRVRGLDAIDGTPVLDIKPYVPLFDRVEHARIPGWMEQLMQGYF
ncbi:MAG: tRNA (N6-threonylcarbamoyladenosine(37)-N6)-methyltransferase TrmO [Herpetosiphonaceae bacterium]|nr:MAG: tRNA (N6-threonylcarbamoyladenosine(37)-N6)-methyltransferase TrmO [Herpetosiphonaceae bacterium]